MRTVLVHLNVELPDDDERTAEQVTRAIEGAIEVGSDDPALDGLTVVVALSEEV